MKKIHFIYFTIIVAVMLMIYDITELDFNNLKNESYAGIVSNILLITALLLTIRDVKNKS